jgi:uncharacterized protein YbbK (DUF523 family)
MNRILISSCLMGNKVRYDGNDCNNLNDILKTLQEANILVPFCPEVSAGLPIPRLPAEINNFDLKKILLGDVTVLDQKHNDITGYYHNGAKMALQLCLSLSITMAILKEHSPSCGVHEIYDGNFSGKKIKGMGVTTSLLKQNGIMVFSENEIYGAFEFHKTL